MNADDFETFDAAYALGSLSAQDRLAFESHLQTCQACSARVAESSKLANLLKLAPEAAFGGSVLNFPFGANPDPQSSASLQPTTRADLTPAWAAEPLPDTLLPRLLREIRRERNRHRLVGVASLVAAACIFAVIAVTLSNRSSNPDQPPPQASAMANIADAPIQAKAEILTKDSWAQVNVWCTYNAHVFADGNYQAVARTKSGQTVLIGTWPGVPGQTAVIRTPTHLRTTEIASIDIISSAGTTLTHLAV